MAISFAGLKKYENVDPFTGIEKKRPELTFGRLLQTPGEALKRTGRHMTRSFRTHFAAGGWDEFKAAAEVDFGGIDKMAAGMIADRPELGGRMQDKIDAGMDESAARIETAREYFEQRKARIIEQAKEVEESEFLENAPEFRGSSSGFIEDVTAGLFGTLPSIAATAITPVLGFPMIYTHMQGALHEQIETTAKIKGVDISDERIFKISQMGAAVMTPLELVGNLLQIKSIMGTGAFTKHLSHIALAMGGEGLTEFAQKYPEEVAVRMALNPDLNSDEIMDLVYETVTDLNVFEEALYEGAVGAVSGGVMVGSGKVAVGAIDALVSPKQKMINRQKREKIKNYMQTEELTPEQQRDFLRTTGMVVEETSTDQQVAEIVEQVKQRILFQATPIQSQEKNELIDSVDKLKLAPEHTELAFALWDGIARKSAEEGLISKPEDFYREWLADVKAQPYAEFVDKQGIQYQNGRINLNLNFDKWFKGSRATEDFQMGSDPRTFYHGTKIEKDFDYFDPSRAHEYGGETAFFFSQNPKLAEAYMKDITGEEAGGRIVPAYLKATKPLIADFAGAGFSPEKVGYYIKQAKSGGYDSLILKNIRDEGILDNQWLVFDNKQIKSVYNRGAWDPASNRIMFQTDAGIEAEGYVYGREAVTEAERIVYQEKRGAITNLFDLTPKVIHLFEGADPSTLIHETGHMITALIYQAGHPDYLIAAKWAGVDEARALKGLDQWSNKELEKFAKGFERYMMEGRSPTMAMAKVFAKIKSLLVELYRHIKNEYFRDVKLTDEMRTLFDRWVESERMRQLDPFFDVADWYRAEDVSLAEADRIKAELKKMGAQPREAFLSEYDEIVLKARKMIAGRLAEKKRQMEAELKKQFRAEAEKSIADEPYYLMLDEILASGGLKADMVAGLYDREWLLELQKKRPGLIAKDGIPPDIISTQYDYDTIDEMLQDIFNRPTKKQAIEFYYNDMWREYEAVEHLNQADTFAEALQTEIEIINELLGKKKPAARRDLKKIIRQQTGIRRTEDSRQLAADLKRDEQVARTAWNEARRAATAETKGKLTVKNKERLLKIREQQLQRIVNLKESHLERVKRLRQNYKDRAFKEKIHKRVSKIIRRKNMIPEYKAQMVNFLSQYYKIPKSWSMDIPSISFADFIAGLEAEGEQISALLQLEQKAPPPKSKGELSAEEAEVIGEIINGLAHLERSARKQMLYDQKKAIDEVVQQNIKAIVDSHKKTGELKHPIEVGRAPKFFERMSNSSKRFFAQLQKAEFIFKDLDGYEDFGPNHESIFGGIKRAEDAELVIGEQSLDKVKDLFKGFGRKWATKMYEISGIPTMVTKEEMIMICLNAGNQGNLAALKAGNDIHRESIEEIIDKLTNKEIDLIFTTWKMIDSLFPELNKVHKTLTGVNLKKVEGYYFPMIFNRRLSWRAGKYEQQRQDRDLFAHEYIRPTVEAGHRIERRGGKMGLNLSFGVITRHLKKVIHDVTHQIPVRNAQRIVNHPEYREAIRHIVGPATYSQLNPWLASIASPRMEPQSELEKYMGQLRRNATVVALGLKLSVAAKQTLSLTQTMDEIGVLPTLRGMMAFYSNPWAAKRFVNELSPAMRHRRKAWDRELGQFYQGFSPKAFKGLAWMRDAYFALISLMDSMATYPTWIASYQAGMDKWSQNQIKAIDYADMVVRTTQPAARPKDLAEIQRGGELKKIMTMFYTFFSVYWNRRSANFRKLKMGKVNIAQYIRSEWYLSIFPAIMAMAISDREWPKDPWEITKAIFTYNMGGIPGIRDVARGIVSKYDYTLSPALGGPREIQRLARAVTAEDPEAQRIAKRSIMLAGYLCGLPSAQITVTLDGLIDMIEGRTSNPTNLLFREKKK